MDLRLNANMSKNLITIQQDSDLIAAYALMAKNKIRHLPVVNTEEQIVGILSERDLLRATDSAVYGDGVFRMESCELAPDKLVRDYMSWPVKTVDKYTPLKSVCGKMMQEKISAYLITDTNQIVGIVTTDDMLKALYSLLSEPESPLKTKFESVLLNPSIGQFAQSISDMGI